MRRFTYLATALLALGCGHAAAQSSPADTKTVLLGVPATTADLSGLRGGTDITVNDMQIDGTTSGNSARYVQTGTNTIADGSFANMNGIPVVIQNTGANVLIQNALIINLQMQ
ncbi:MAG: hypothetical protein EOO30_18770 [Comamonadaceae bacterium]|nr:MAG: hypothetical protein EOO30_18770 [Comamonadaceae bacterium]